MIANNVGCLLEASSLVATAIGDSVTGSSAAARAQSVAMKIAVIYKKQNDV